MKIVHESRCIEYLSPGHPDSPERIIQAVNYLSDSHQIISAPLASAEQILLAHTEEHFASIENLSFIEPDCPQLPNMAEYAKLAAGAAILASEIGGFSLMRPPGHHAGPGHVAGFCYLNNIAIAVKSSAKRTLIIDVDGHHGDGTQEIFFGDPQVDFLSLHSAPNYPGTGLSSEANCYNYPLPLRCGEEIYMETLKRAFANINLSEIEQIAISAGFDTYEADPLASLGLSTKSYELIGQTIAELSLPLFAVLEGGYFAPALGPNIEQFIYGLDSQSGISSL